MRDARDPHRCAARDVGVFRREHDADRAAGIVEADEADDRAEMSVSMRPSPAAPVAVPSVSTWSSGARGCAAGAAMASVSVAVARLTVGGWRRTIPAAYSRVLSSLRSVGY